MKKLDTLLAEKLIQISAIKLQPDSPFSWATGWNSPIYTDLRMTLSYPGVRNLIKVEMARLIMENFGDAEMIAGIATGAIAHAALVADSLALPMVYVRSKPKDHGLETVREAGGIVLGVVVIFDYRFSQAARALKRAKLPVITLTDLETMLDVAIDGGHITTADAETLQQWHNDPENWAPTGLDAVD